MSDVAADTPRAATPQERRTGALAIAVLIGFGLLYAYDLFEAISSLVQVPEEIAVSNAVFGREVAVPWTALIAATVLPPLVFAVSAIAGRRRTVGARVLILAVGLAVVATLTLSITAYVRAGGL